MKIAMSGARGFVGTALSKAFEQQGWGVIPLGRDAFRSEDMLRSRLAGVDGVVHLAGAPIAARWTAAYKQEIYESRIGTTKLLVDTMLALPQRPRFFLSTSAIGIYPPTIPCDEAQRSYANDFLGKVAQDWEGEAQRAAGTVRTVIFRFGVVLGSGGGILQKMLPPFRFGLGGVIGDGTQPFSWVHIDDLAAAYLFVINQERCSGVYNLVAPHPTTNAGLTQALGAVLHRPTVLPVPSFVLKLRFGEGADIMLKGQHVLPRRLLESGFKFRFSDVEAALQDIIDRK